MCDLTATLYCVIKQKSKLLVYAYNYILVCYKPFIQYLYSAFKQCFQSI